MPPATLIALGLSAVYDQAVSIQQIPNNINDILDMHENTTGIRTLDAGAIAPSCDQLRGMVDLTASAEWCNSDESRITHANLCEAAYVRHGGEHFKCEPKRNKNTGLMKNCVMSKISVEKSEGCNQGCLLPLGDSITQAYVGRTGYRYRLWKKLVDAGVFFQWVGTTTEHTNKGWTESHDPPSQDVLNPDYKGYEFPRQNEGHSGWRTDEVASHLKSWLATYSCQPTCALIHLGTNDMRQDESVPSTVKDLHDVIDILKESGGDPTILLAVPIPTCGKRVGPELAPEIPSFEDPARKIFVVPMDVPQGSFSKADDCFDYCHPNDRGEAKIAQQFFEAMQKHCVRH